MTDNAQDAPPIPLDMDELLTLRLATMQAAEANKPLVWIGQAIARRVAAQAGNALRQSERWQIERGSGSADGMLPIDARALSRALDQVEAHMAGTICRPLGEWQRLSEMSRRTLAAFARPKPGATTVAEPGTFTAGAPFVGGHVPPRAIGLAGEHGSEAVLPIAKHGRGEDNA